jgi:hypothetical protein
VFKRCGCVTQEMGGGGESRCPRLSRRGHGSWYFVLELPASGEGAGRQYKRGGFRTKAAAAAAREHLMTVDVEDPRGLVRVGQWLDVWLAGRHGLSESTRRIYTQHVEDYLKPALRGAGGAECGAGAGDVHRADPAQHRGLAPLQSGGSVMGARSPARHERRGVGERMIKHW